MSTTPDETPQPTIQNITLPEETPVVATPSGLFPSPQNSALLAPVPVKKKLFARLVTWLWVLSALGLVIALVGGALLLGSRNSSGPAITTRSAKGTVGLISFTISPSGNGSISESTYIGLNDGETFYYKADDFPSSLSVKLNDTVSVLYRPDQTVNMQQFFPNLQVPGPTYEAVQVTIYASNGQNPQIFNSAQYAASIGKNTNPADIAILIAGLAVAVLAATVAVILLVRKNRRHEVTGVAPAVAIEPPPMETPQSY